MRSTIPGIGVGKMIKIGDFSKLSRISIRMLRHYNDIDLLVPCHIDEFTGYRYYNAEQLATANRIQALKDMGFSLSVINDILKTYNDPDSLKSYLLILQSQMRQEAEQMEKKLLLVENTLRRIGKDELIMNYAVTVKEIPQRNVASLRKIMHTYGDEGQLWEQMRNEIVPQNVQFDNPCLSTAVFHDEGYKESDIDVEIQVSIAGKYNDTQSVQFKMVQSVTVASAIVKGSYDQLIAACEAIGNWVTDNKYDFNGAMFCIYHVSPGQDQNPENWVTEVCFPVKKA